LVIGIDATDLASASALAPGSLEGIQLLVMDARPGDDVVDLVRAVSPTGATFAVLVGPSSAYQRIDELVFDVRTRTTQLRATAPELLLLVDADAFAAVRVPLDAVMPYADAVVHGPEPLRADGSMWLRLPQASMPTVEDLSHASLTSGGERVLLPVSHLDWRVVQDFAAVRPELVEVTGARRLTVGEILARYQARQHRQDAIVNTTTATGTTTLLFEVADFAAPITITAETTIFRGPDGTDIEEKGIRVNGAAIAGGGATSPPELPLIEAERISTPPLLITLNEAYRYALEGEEPVGRSRCYVVSFEPRVAARGLARGRAWIDTRAFTLRRLETIQRDLRGASFSRMKAPAFGRRFIARLPSAITKSTARHLPRSLPMRLHLTT
jgi:hypothetical protein